VTELLEIGRVALGTMFAISALALSWVTIRAWAYGRSAYETNRNLTYPSVWKTALGQLKQGEGHNKNRAKQGLAIDIRSRCLVGQQRLSEEAINDVIGRRV